MVPHLVSIYSAEASNIGHLGNGLSHDLLLLRWCCGFIVDSYLIESNIREEARLKVEAEKEKEADGAALPWKTKKVEEGKEGKRGKNWKERAPRWHVAQSACHEEAWSVEQSQVCGTYTKAPFPGLDAPLLTDAEADNKSYANVSIRRVKA